MEQGERVEAILDAAGVLPPEDDAGLVLRLGPPDVVGGVDLGDQIGIFAQPGLPPGRVAHRLRKVLPHAAGAIGGGDPAAMHVLEDAAAEIGDIEAVDDDQLVMELGHCTFLPWAGFGAVRSRRARASSVLLKCAAGERAPVAPMLRPTG